MTTVIETRDLYRHFGSEETEVVALDHVSVEIEEGEFYCSGVWRRSFRVRIFSAMFVCLVCFSSTIFFGSLSRLSSGKIFVVVGDSRCFCC